MTSSYLHLVFLPSSGARLRQDLLWLVMELKPLLEQHVVRVHLHHDGAAPPERLRSDAQAAWTEAGLSGSPEALAWGDSRTEARAFDGLLAADEQRAAEHVTLQAQLGVPWLSDRYEVEALAIDRGLVPADLERAFCPLPWWHIHLESDGVATPCCNAPSHDGGPSLSDHSLPEVFNSPRMRRVRLNMLRGVRDSTCRDCWKQEEIRKHSLRKKVLKNTPPPAPEIRPGVSSIAEWAAHARAITLEDGTIPADRIAPTRIDIRWSNVCNFRCRMCWHRSSSSWFEDTRRIAAELATAEHRDVGQALIVLGSKAVRSFNDDEAAVQKLLPFLGRVTHVYSAGGEPLMMDEHFELLEQLRPNASKIDLHYTSNLSRLDHRGRDILEIWRPYRSVDVGVSSDGLGPIGEYVRTGFKTERFIENIQRLREAARSHNVTYWIAFTISIYNVFHLPDFVREVLANRYVERPDQISLNIVRTPWYASPYVLPRPVRERVIASYEALFAELERDYPGTAFGRLNDSVITALRTASDALFPLHRHETWTWLERLDRIRSTSWREVIPHMSCFEAGAAPPGTSEAT